MAERLVLAAGGPALLVVGVLEVVVVVGADGRTRAPLRQGRVRPAGLRARRAHGGLIVVSRLTIAATAAAGAGQTLGLVAEVGVHQPHQGADPGRRVPEPHTGRPHFGIHAHALTEGDHDVEHVEGCPQQDHRQVDAHHGSGHVSNGSRVDERQEVGGGVAGAAALVVEDLRVVDAVQVRLDATAAAQSSHEDGHGDQKPHEARAEEGCHADADGVLARHAHRADFLEDHIAVFVHLQSRGNNCSQRDQPGEQHHAQGAACAHTAVVVVGAEDVDEPVNGDHEGGPQGERTQEHLDEQPGAADGGPEGPVAM